MSREAFAELQITLTTRDFSAGDVYTLTNEECIRVGLCQTDHIDIFFDTLLHKTPLDIIDVFKDDLTQTWRRTTGFTWKERESFVRSGVANVFLDPLDYYRYALVLGFYLLASIVTMVLYCSRKKLRLESKLRLSSLSKAIFRYLVMKLVGTIAYVVVLFVNNPKLVREERRVEKLFVVFFFYCFWTYLLNIATFIGVVLFSLGFGTKLFQFTSQKRTKISYSLTIYFLQFNLTLCKHLYPNWIFAYSYLRTIMIMGLFMTVLYFGYNTYQVDPDQRFLKSACIIVGAFFLNPFVTLPIDNLGAILVGQVLGDGKLNKTSEGKHIPEIIELIALMSLVYIWREVRDDEKIDTPLEIKLA